jgi:hypothetical protein
MVIEQVEIKFDNSFLDLLFQKLNFEMFSKLPHEYDRNLRRYVDEQNLGGSFLIELKTPDWERVNFHAFTFIRDNRVSEQEFVANLSKLNRKLRAIVHS